MHRVWKELCRAMEEKYVMAPLWDKGYRDGVYEYKYRRGGKTLCTLYARENAIGFLVIFGRDERAKWEAHRSEFAAPFCRIYDEAPTFHDGKWVMYFPANTSMIDDLVRLLSLKRQPNRK